MARDSFLYIWLPHWPLQRLRASDPDLQACAVVVHAPDSRQTERVVCCSQLAYRCGVRPGMPIPEVMALRHRSSNSSSVRGLASSTWHLEPANSAKDRAQLHDLAMCLRHFTPLVGIELSDPAEGFVLNVGSIQHLWHSRESLAGTIRSTLQQRGYVCRIGVGCTMGSAWAVAHADPRSRKSPVVVDPQDPLQTLGPLPLYALRIPTATIQLLHDVGITECHQLARLPRAALQTRFGSQLLERWDQACGHRSEVWEMTSEEPDFQVAHQLEHPTGQRAHLDIILQPLVRDLCRLLQQHQRGLLQLACHFRFLSARPVSLDISFFLPTANWKHIWELVDLQLESIDFPGRVQEIRLEALSTDGLSEQQLSFAFDHRTQAGLGPLVDRLSTRLGSERVLRVQLRSDVQPEQAYRLHAWTEQRAVDRGNLVPPPCPFHRPLYLHPICSIEMFKTTSLGHPLLFQHDHTSHKVLRHWGPERIETGWWKRQCMIRRDYYRVETDAGHRLWIFHQLRRDAWFLHGTFL